MTRRRFSRDSGFGQDDGSNKQQRSEQITGTKGRQSAVKLYRTGNGIFVEDENRFYPVPGVEWDPLIATPGLHAYLRSVIHAGAEQSFDAATILAPVGSQEVWAAGVTYYRSRNARIEESKSAGGGDFYDRVYAAERPELFFKATGRRVIGHQGAVRVRNDARWSVPEPELTLVINAVGEIVGYTIGNDMSSRDIEGENPLYLPQAKVYDGSCALGPCILVSSRALCKTTGIHLEIARGGSERVQRQHDAGGVEARSEGAGAVSVSRKQLSARGVLDDGDRSGAAG